MPIPTFASFAEEAGVSVIDASRHCMDSSAPGASGRLRGSRLALRMLLTHDMSQRRSFGGPKEVPV
jgi:hypothetical protein